MTFFYIALALIILNTFVQELKHRKIRILSNLITHGYLLYLLYMFVSNIETALLMLFMRLQSI